MTAEKEGATTVAPSTPAYKEKFEEAKRLLANGVTLAEAARVVGVRHTTLRMWTDPIFAERQRQLQKERLQRYGKPCKTCGRITSGGNGRAKAPDYCHEHVSDNPKWLAAQQRRCKWTRENVLDAIRDWYVLYGDTPSGMDWNPTVARQRGQHLRAQRWENGNFPWFTQVYRLFGSWNAAIAEAGFTPRKPGGFSENAIRRVTKYEEWTGNRLEDKPPERRRRRNLSPTPKKRKLSMVTNKNGRKYWTSERLLEKIQEFNAQNGRPPKANEWLERVPIVDGHRIWPSPSEMIREFGSWSRAIRAAGLKPQHEKKRLKHEEPPQVIRRWTNEEILTLIQQWHTEHGIIPTQTDWMNKNDYPGPSTVKKHFGTWSDAIKEAGLVPFGTGLTKKAVAKYLPLKKVGP